MLNQNERRNKMLNVKLKVKYFNTELCVLKYKKKCMKQNNMICFLFFLLLSEKSGDTNNNYQMMLRVLSHIFEQIALSMHNEKLIRNHTLRNGKQKKTFQQMFSFSH